MSDFNRIRPGYELVKVNFEWNVWMRLRTTKGYCQTYRSPLFSSPQLPDSKWQLELEDTRSDSDDISICLSHNNSAEKIEPVLVKMSILNCGGQKVLQQTQKMGPRDKSVDFIDITKEELLKYECEQFNRSVTFHF